MVGLGIIIPVQLQHHLHWLLLLSPHGTVCLGQGFRNKISKSSHVSSMG